MSAVLYKINKGREFVIGGYTLDAVMIGYYQDEKLLYAGKVRAGFVPNIRREIMAAGPQAREPEEQKGFPMPIRLYRGFSISIQRVSTSGSHNLHQVAKISNEGGELLTSLYCPGEFATYGEAENNCFEIAEKSIEEHIQKSISKCS